MSVYAACVIGALGLYALLWRGRWVWRGLGLILGLAALAALPGQVLAATGADASASPSGFFYVFALIAVGAAVRMITHTRPVYAALYFVLVVLSSAALFLLLEAEFLAFALVIVYAGAILITYLFVIMLAQQAAEPGHAEEQAAYDVFPREPAGAVMVGFIMLAMLSHMIVQGSSQLNPADDVTVARRAWTELERMPRQLEEAVTRQARIHFDAEPNEIQAPVGGFRVDFDGQAARVPLHLTSTGEFTSVVLPPEEMPQNVQSVGLALVEVFPASLELAGIILLMAMFGAVVLARRQMELSEDEVREAAGLPRLDLVRDDEPDASGEVAGAAP